MAAPDVDVDYSSLHNQVGAISIMKMALDVELRTFLDEHGLSPLRPQAWAAELVDSLLGINVEYRQRLSEMIYKQARILGKLTALADFDAKLQDMLKVESKNGEDLSKVESMLSRKRDTMNAAQRAFFDRLLAMTRESHAVTICESAGARAQFRKIRHLLEFLSQPQDQLVVLMASVPPVASSSALRAAVTPPLEALEALSAEREAMVSRADAIEFEAAQWDDTCASYAERVESFALVTQLRNNMKAQRATQSNALAQIAVETTAANGGSNSLQNFPGVTWGPSDLLGVATQYSSLVRYRSMLEELQGQVRIAVDRALIKLSQEARG